MVNEMHTSITWSLGQSQKVRMSGNQEVNPMSSEAEQRQQPSLRSSGSQPELVAMFLSTLALLRLSAIKEVKDGDSQNAGMDNCSKDV